MNYEFPTEGLTQPLCNHWAKELPDFIEILDKNGFHIYDYVVQRPDTFTGPLEPLLREMRGLVFAPDGTVARRGLHKFFNVGERPDTQTAALPRGVAYVQEKVDGSMVTPVLVGGGVRWMTRKGITDIARQAEAWAASRPDLLAACENSLQGGKCPIFEWCSPDNRVVLEHSEPLLYHLTTRRMDIGTYPPSGVAEGAFPHTKVPRIIEEHDVQALLERAAAEENTEGYVIVWENGHRVKIKTLWYVGLHRSISILGNRRHLFGVVLDGQLDDVLPLLTEDKRQEAEEFAEQVHNSICRTAERLASELEDARSMGRKAYALQEKAWNRGKISFLGSLVFRAFDRDPLDCQEIVREVCRQQLTSNARFEQLKREIGLDV